MRSGKKHKDFLFSFVALLLLLASCAQDKLPYYYEREGIANGDTLYYTLPEWDFVNQDSLEVSSTDYKGKIWVADFFFTHCPTICPYITSNLKKVQLATKELPLHIVSFTVDPKNDTPWRLKNYIDKNGIDDTNWTFLTGEKEDLYHLGEFGFKQVIQENADEPGGFLHTSFVSLIDRESHVRGIYDGTDNKEIDRLINDIKKLVQEYD